MLENTVSHNAIPKTDSHPCRSVKSLWRRFLSTSGRTQGTVHKGFAACRQNAHRLSQSSDNLLRAAAARLKPFKRPKL
jgi:hypothetical protein